MVFYKQKEIDYIVASDTDSIYVTLDKLVEKTCKDKTKEQKIDFLDKVVEKKLEPYIAKCFDELADYSNAFKNAMVMKREVIADKGIWVAKKRYILNVLDEEGVRLAEPKLKLMGIGAVKSSTPGVCRVKIKEQLKLLCQKNKKIYISYQILEKNFLNYRLRRLPFRGHVII